jgi:hypothetical protein
VHQVLGHKGPAGLGVVHDPLHLFEVQLGIDRHHHQSCPPGAKNELQVARVVAHEDQHPVARHQALRQQLAAQPGTALGPLAVGGAQLGPLKNGGLRRRCERSAFEQMGQIHGANPLGRNFNKAAVCFKPDSDFKG